MRAAVAVLLMLACFLPADFASSPVPSGPPWFRDAWIRFFGADADEVYRVAERQYMAGDFENAELSCWKALKQDPRHAPARALAQELHFLLGKGGGSTDDDRPWGCPRVKEYQQMHVELEIALARGNGHVLDGDRAQAEREYRRILEYAKWMPETPEFQRAAERARLGLAHLPRPKP